MDRRGSPQRSQGEEPQLGPGLLGMEGFREIQESDRSAGTG